LACICIVTAGAAATLSLACSGRFVFLFLAHAINMNAAHATTKTVALPTTIYIHESTPLSCLASSAAFTLARTMSFCVVCVFVVVYLTSHVASGLSSFTPIYTLLEADVVNWKWSSFALAVSRAILCLNIWRTLLLVPVDSVTLPFVALARMVTIVPFSTSSGVSNM